MYFVIVYAQCFQVFPYTAFQASHAIYPISRASTVAPPLLPVSVPATVSQPLFPVVANNNISTQAPPFSAPQFSTSVPLSSSAEHNGSTDLHGSNISSLANSYHTPGFPDWGTSNTCILH
ncbi:hypothetical protein POM88_051790 [Heracleum sosnowskyi]|uniref:Uncharacterized protein n=1 Tax=Heracleum sosnowskyi TaxID=360622 RepID=A0AAD8M3Q6_9APIA|nr:hypothetical protein POM88_051790 [Heracleum sosnowskyi]